MLPGGRPSSSHSRNDLVPVASPQHRLGSLKNVFVRHAVQMNQLLLVVQNVSDQIENDIAHGYISV
ncbi:hypothetical protein ACRAWB_18300 [Leifsonia poae]|uniref:hypothetical protein n=1 Tax=Leifsonia poae TaxID=110933 RepID=UPI003D69CBF4